MFKTFQIQWADAVGYCSETVVHNQLVKRLMLKLNLHACTGETTFANPIDPEPQAASIPHASSNLKNHILI